ncbi:SDR family NAD(P)-dependent oxidoreductase [Mycobacterium sp. CVI_P3]|uniref:SDR family NAD(P)-dependent oxidoreductase n=1 Tax=Mycobacterium pinniadriaticum TaxID=2994102 RepID=A0ABT3SDZ6_9MYCO|nr:SDR family NAD(P)-dependent oxidoreductase [Mycobacterium pinniadriaticum]MCX2930678.1 SDR family NAD(P)-dependent oxidoreductase [Mycobacterium pinniadriaticum]MCX2937102.1 SDR family NAD(P)-dependent oxidoreductase [Mycobacterium pinniadriaticum]
MTNSPEAAAKVVSDIEFAGGQAHAVYASAADGDSRRAATESIAENLGEVDLLVSNAGTTASE